MAGEVEHKPVTDALAVCVAQNARESDRMECEAAYGEPVEDTIDYSVRLSRYARVMMVDGDPLMAYGVAAGDIGGNTGIPWMIGTNAIEAHQTAFLRETPKLVSDMLAIFPYLANIVDDRNEAAKRWLQWLGFRLGDTFVHGPENRLFRYFDMEAPACAAFQQ